MIVRRLIIAVAALLLCVQVVRNAAAVQLADVRPDAAAKLWADHPSVAISRGLTSIGAASRKRDAIDPAIFAAINAAAAKAPLAPEPYLVRGVQAQTSGDIETARRAFEAAQWRDPRSRPAAYFLAQYYFESGRPLDGLQQVALLARLSGGTEIVAPYLAAYARDSAHWPQMRALFRSQEGLEDGVLAALAQDPGNTDAVLALADESHRRPDSRWVTTLLSSLVDAGEYARARVIWASVGRAGNSSSLLYDANFSSPVPPPPFNWDFTTSTVGLAERQPRGQLHVIFYGNVDGVLARQLLTLPLGAYRMRMRFTGTPVHAETLGWAIRCNKVDEPFSTASSTEVATRGWTFQVPGNCAAQWLELSGRSADVAQQAEATIGGLSLEKVGGNE